MPISICSLPSFPLGFSTLKLIISVHTISLLLTGVQNEYLAKRKLKTSVFSLDNWCH